MVINLGPSIASFPSPSNPSGVVNYTKYRTLTGTVRLRLTDVSGILFKDFSMVVRLLDASGNLVGQGTAKRTWGQPGVWVTLANLGSNLKTVRIQVLGATATSPSGTPIPPMGYSFDWSGQLDAS